VQAGRPTAAGAAGVTSTINLAKRAQPPVRRDTGAVASTNLRPVYPVSYLPREMGRTISRGLTGGEDFYDSLKDSHPSLRIYNRAPVLSRIRALCR
jgi:hypothetical protein